MHQVVLVSVSAVSNAYANEPNISELSTEFLELSGLVWCAMDFHCIVHGCPESRRKPQPCLAAGTTKSCCSVPHASKAMAGDILSLWGQAFAVQDVRSQGAGSWAASPQTPVPWHMGTSQPATSFNLDKLILPLEALLSGFKWIYQHFLFFFFFPGEKGTRTKKSYTCKIVLRSFEHCST